MSRIFLAMLLVAVLVLPNAAAAQNVEYAGSALWTGANDAVVDGDYAYWLGVIAALSIDEWACVLA